MAPTVDRLILLSEIAGYRKHNGRYRVVAEKLLLVLVFAVPAPGGRLPRDNRPPDPTMHTLIFSRKTLVLAALFRLLLPYAGQERAVEAGLV
jgi:hypothetical protein